MKPSPPAQHEPDASEEGPFLEGIPGYLATIGLGGAAFAFPLAAYIPALHILAYVDLPFAFFCFLAASVIGLGSRQRLGLVLLGVLLAACGVLLAALHLLLFSNHPWLS